MHRRMLAEVSLEANHAHTRIGTVKPLEHREGCVTGTVVDEDQLVGVRAGLERLDRAAIDIPDRLGLVEHRDDDGEIRRDFVAVDSLYACDNTSLDHRMRA